jgi:hypothetical protein
MNLKGVGGLMKEGVHRGSMNFLSKKKKKVLNKPNKSKGIFNRFSQSKGE